MPWRAMATAQFAYVFLDAVLCVLGHGVLLLYRSPWLGADNTYS